MGIRATVSGYIVFMSILLAVIFIVFLQLAAGPVLALDRLQLPDQGLYLRHVWGLFTGLRKLGESAQLLVSV
jgi:hypothetical protein